MENTEQYKKIEEVMDTNNTAINKALGEVKATLDNRQS